MKSLWLTINGIKHKVYTFGKKTNTPLLFLHGWMDTGASFNWICQSLQDQYYCIAPDLRGFGQSSHNKNPNGYFFYEYVSDVHDLVQHFSPNNPIRLVGHSMGGNIASMYAGAFPEKVSHLVNIEGFGIRDVPPERGPQTVREWIEKRNDHSFKVYKTLKEIAQRLQKTNPKLPSDKALFLAKAMTKKVRGGFVIAADAKHKMKSPYLFRLNNITPFWKNIQAKCHHLIAENTEMSLWMGDSDKLMDEIKSRLSFFPDNSQTTFIKEAGHMLHHEKPDEVAQIIKKFVTN